MSRVSLGIDTSCYTTSLVAMDEQLKIVYEGRILLDVKKGTVGLRQSDAFFQHVQNLPVLYEACLENLIPSDVHQVVVSSKPRNVEGSYMPVFTAGIQFARVIAKTLKVPLLMVSHQENHLYASEYNHTIPNAFIGVHISGGTSEILHVKKGACYEISLLGGTLDLSFGKLIDRLGVYMGFDFPAGKQLDEISYESDSTYPLKHSIKALNFNISGVENQLKQYYDRDKNAIKIARTLFGYIGGLLLKILEEAKVQNALETVVLSGGVAANRTIRQVLEQFSGNIIFTDIEYATDHAIGNAYYGVKVMTY